MTVTTMLYLGGAGGRAAVQKNQRPARVRAFGGGEGAHQEGVRVLEGDGAGVALARGQLGKLAHAKGRLVGEAEVPHLSGRGEFRSCRREKGAKK